MDAPGSSHGLEQPPRAEKDSYTKAMAAILNSIPHSGLSANYRIFRHGCDSQHIKELQFEEPSSLDQFEHIGNMLAILHTPSIALTNLAYAPYKTQVNVPVAENTIDREYEPYSIAVSIRNSSVHWKQLDQLLHLIGSKFPALLGSITAPWVGKPYILGENGEVCRMNVWYTQALGKVIENIESKGTASLCDTSPLVNQICIKENSCIPISF